MRRHLTRVIGLEKRVEESCGLDSRTHLLNPHYQINLIIFKITLIHLLRYFFFLLIQYWFQRYTIRILVFVTTFKFWLKIVKEKSLLVVVLLIIWFSVKRSFSSKDNLLFYFAFFSLYHSQKSNLLNSLQFLCLPMHQASKKGLLLNIYFFVLFQSFFLSR